MRNCEMRAILSEQLESLLLLKKSGKDKFNQDQIEHLNEEIRTLRSRIELYK